MRAVGEWDASQPPGFPRLSLGGGDKEASALENSSEHTFQERRPPRNPGGHRPRRAQSQGPQKGGRRPVSWDRVPPGVLDWGGDWVWPGGGVCVWGAGLGYVRASGEGRGPQRTAPVGGGPGLENGRTDSPPSADGKLYDAYVSYSDSPEDRKFVNFILKPQLERRRGYKLFLDDRDLLPRAGTTVLLPVPALPGPRPRP